MHSDGMALRLGREAMQATRIAMQGVRIALQRGKRAPTHSYGGSVEKKQARFIKALKEMQKFLDDRTPLASLNTSGARKRLDNLVIGMTDFAVVQSASGTAAKSATRKMRLLTRDLIDKHMTPIAKVAKAELPSTLEITALGLPKARETNELLVAAARGMASEAAKYEQTFIDAGLPQDFLKQLRAATDALAAYLVERKQHVGERGAATKLLPEGLAEARRVVNMLDSFVKKVGDPATIAAWTIVKRLPRAPGVKSEAEVPTSTPAAPKAAA